MIALLSSSSLTCSPQWVGGMVVVDLVEREVDHEPVRADHLAGQSHRRDSIPFWTDSSDPDAVDGGYVELRVRELSRFDLRRRDPATCPDEIWSRVRSMKPSIRSP